MSYGGRRPYGSYPRRELPPLSPTFRRNYAEPNVPPREPSRPVILPSIADKYADGATYRRHRMKSPAPPVDESIYDFSDLSTKLPPIRPPARGKECYAPDNARRPDQRRRPVPRTRTYGGALGFRSSTDTRRY
ncbi:uncharacterized protein LOC110455258 [Mizuhopecten yessoensis]|uniref:Uncharacterized protein n=1 Tax=Mizuhopecten yessoensis TaxID=6573 RepID=A0A210QDF4_MIZYE|nr:uncharacterized protein LOC110455258 [Mizuhopecten yessoensis]XP_021360937.1 uncharacterized protein LOC110455258 [Mizuhopecten yessoensis]XP_021360938.1 uncharacterized protein LOC110455258 [Mizuhopecten yessoensis]OWF46769.1 hypothetical protein KP79_PYT18881 [Mizuhopecten yessoensis]